MKLNALCFWCGWSIALAICGWTEWQRLMAATNSPAGPFGWFSDWNLDTTLPFLVLITLPLWLAVNWFSGSRLHAPVRTSVAIQNDPGRPSQQQRGAWLVSAAVFALSLVCSASIGLTNIEIEPAQSGHAARTARFLTLPPAYHDEYSYRLQAQTFLAGRISWPAPPVQPQLFHQMHVLSEPVTASRYFPWTGLWMLPFVAAEPVFGAGWPYVGHWIAGALAALFFHRALLRLLSAPWSHLGGILVALCPGLAVFANLLLAHQPTLLALSVFFLFWLRLRESFAHRDAFIAGGALTLAMLGRPMTAAGFALPFGLALLVDWFRTLRQLRLRAGTEPQSHTDGRTAGMRWTLLVTLGAPLLSGFATLAIMNERTTGDWKVSPYQLYTDTWTPRHRYGFDNAVRGAELVGPQVLDRYDHWAANLTPETAIRNVSNRCLASAQWTLGIPALVCLLIAGLPRCMRNKQHRGHDLRLVLLAVVSLHAVHVPYWFDGILHWHYVFETAPLLIILAAAGAQSTWQALPVQLPRRGRVVWLSALLTASLCPTWAGLDSLWGPSRISLAVGEQSFSRVRMELFRTMLESAQVRKPCLVLVDESASDPQLSYIVNPPHYSGEVLVCRVPLEPEPLRDLARQFSDRNWYLFNPDTFELSEWEQRK